MAHIWTAVAAQGNAPVFENFRQGALSALSCCKINIVLRSLHTVQVVISNHIKNLVGFRCTALTLCYISHGHNALAAAPVRFYCHHAPDLYQGGQSGAVILGVV